MQRCIKEVRLEQTKKGKIKTYYALTTFQQINFNKHCKYIPSISNKTFYKKPQTSQNI